MMGCPEDEARWFFQQFIIGLDYCHRMGIANRDIKVRCTRARLRTHHPQHAARRRQI